MPITIIYHDLYNEFLMPVNDRIKFWNALDGKVSRTYMNVTTSPVEITACILDNNQK